MRKKSSKSSEEVSAPVGSKILINFFKLIRYQKVHQEKKVDFDQLSINEIAF